MWSVRRKEQPTNFTVYTNIDRPLPQIDINRHWGRRVSTRCCTISWIDSRRFANFVPKRLIFLWLSLAIGSNRHKSTLGHPSMLVAWARVRAECRPGLCHPGVFFVHVHPVPWAAYLLKSNLGHTCSQQRRESGPDLGPDEPLLFVLYSLLTARPVLAPALAKTSNQSSPMQPATADPD